MHHEDFNYHEHGFVGHLAEPDSGSDRAVLVILGGEQSVLPGVKIAERFADFGITGLAVSLYGAEGLPVSPDRIPLEMFRPALDYLRQQKSIQHISVYGQSMGSIFAALTAQYIGGIENVILVSPTHVPFEGTTPDKKQMTGHSVATYQGRDIPFVRADFSAVKAARYQHHPAAQHKVMGMWCAYYAAYQDKAAVQQARLALEKTNARILMIAGQADEAWPAAASVQQMEQVLNACSYPKEVKVILFPHGSHLCGMMPNRAREKWLYRMVPLIGLMYRSFGKYRRENFSYFAQSEREIVAWVKQESCV